MNNTSSGPFHSVLMFSTEKRYQLGYFFQNLYYRFWNGRSSTINTMGRSPETNEVDYSSFGVKTSGPILPTENYPFKDMQEDGPTSIDTTLEQLKLNLENLIQQEQQLKNESKPKFGSLRSSQNKTIFEYDDSVDISPQFLLSLPLRISLPKYPTARPVDIKSQIQFQIEQYTELIPELDIGRKRTVPLESHQVENHLPILCMKRAHHASDHQAQRCYRDQSHGRYCSRCYPTCPVCLAKNQQKNS